MNTRRKILFPIVTVLALTSYGGAMACDCVGPSIEETFDDFSGLIFVGTITDFKDDQPKSSKAHISYSVDEVFKGDLDIDEIISAVTKSSMCDFNPKSWDKPVGEQHLVIAHFVEDTGERTLNIQFCGGSTHVDFRQDTLTFLRENKTRGSMIPCTPSQVPTPENTETDTDETAVETPDTTASSLPAPSATY